MFPESRDSEQAYPHPGRPVTGFMAGLIFFACSFVTCLLWDLISTFVGGFVISDLERPMQGEAPDIAWQWCFMLVFAAEALPPFLAASVICRRWRIPRWPLILLFSTALAFGLIHYGLDINHLLNKAWRRGL